MRIAIIHEHYPWPINSGINSRVASLITHLEKINHEVTLIVASDRKRKIPPRNRKTLVKNYTAPGIKNRLREIKWGIDDFLERINFPTVDSILLKIFKDKFSAKNNDYWLRCPPGLASFVEKEWLANRYDIVIVEYLWMKDSVSLIKDKTLVVLDTIDILSQRALEFKNNGIVFPFSISLEQEINEIDQFDAAIAIQDREATLIKQMVKKTHVIQTRIDLFTPLPPPTIKKTKKILFVGGLNECNTQGIDWFIRNVWPEIIDSMRDIELHIVGRVTKGIAPELQQDSIFIHGFVENITSFYRDADICINPVFFGTGLKIKSVEAIGHSRPLITTNVGIDGITPYPEHACLVANTVNEWVTALKDTLYNEEIVRSMSQASLEYSSKWLSSEEIYAELDNWISMHSNKET